MKKLLFFNKIIKSGDKKEYSVDDKFKYIGLNTGNMAPVEALKKQLLYDKELWFDGHVLEDRSNYIGVIPCANIIGLHAGIAELWWSFIENWDIPVILIGLGAQSTRKFDTPAKLVNALPKERIMALKAICERVISVGIRGEFTAECLELMEIHNYRIIGCPSIYDNMRKHYKKIDLASAENCVMNLLPYTMSAAKTLRFGIKYNLKWILQSLDEMPKTFLENKEIEPRHIANKFPGSNVSADSLEAYMRSNASVFFNLNQWSAYLKSEKFTFSFGGRFHGNVMSLLNGIPALWITHDSRTQELVDIFKLPHIKETEFNAIEDINDLIDLCCYDEFYKEYESMYEAYVDFLDENEIPHI